MAGSLATFEVLGIKISVVNLVSAGEQIDGYIRERKKVYICFAPVSTIVLCQEDPAYRAVVSAADMVTPDGMPLVWIARSRGLRQVQRTYGPDLMSLVCDVGRVKNYRHYLLGSGESTNQKLSAVLKERYPGIQIVGRYSPPFRPLSAAEEDKMICAINDDKADILWVALGSPKQDFWMAQNRDKLNVTVMAGVGAAFDFLSGDKPQAPKWMRQCGLEWFFRLGCEPRRLWHRYLVGNAKFIWFLLKEKLLARKRTG